MIPGDRHPAEKPFAARGGFFVTHRGLDVQEDGKAIFGWALYDWANSAFATTVMASFFPIFFKEYWAAGSDPVVSTAKLGLANSAAGILVALMAPVLGAIADRGAAKKHFLLFFAALGIAATAALYWVPRGGWRPAAACYVFAMLGFAGSIVFYDSLLTTVAAEARRDFVSSLGFSLGYLGGGLLFALNVWMTLSPASFGLPDSGGATETCSSPSSSSPVAPPDRPAPPGRPSPHLIVRRPT